MKTNHPVDPSRDNHQIDCLSIWIYGLKQEGVNFLWKIFENFEGIMKANEESQRKKLRKAMHKVVLVDF